MKVFCCFAIVLIIVLIAILRVIKVNEIEEENQLIQAYMNSMQSFYAMIQNRIEQTRRYRHDLAKHIQTLEVLSRQDQTGDLQEYMDNLRIHYQQLQNEKYTTNEVINTVITIKKQQCEEKEIPLELEIEEEDYRTLTDIDMVGLLFNLLDNAIEASERAGAANPRGISLKMGIQEGRICIRVQNYVAPDEEIKFETYKEEKEEHGIGMKIIEYIVKKYHGERELEIDGKENLFVVKVGIPAAA